MATHKFIINYLLKFAHIFNSVPGIRKFLIVFLILSSTLGFSQLANYKTLYLYNFIKRIEWPKHSKDGNFKVYIIASDDGIYQSMKQIAETKKAGDRTIDVIRVYHPGEIGNADLVFIDYSNRRFIEETALRIGAKPILLVADFKAAEGTDINFIETSDGLDFLIRPQHIKEKGLKVSDMLIQLGKLE